MSLGDKLIILVKYNTVRLQNHNVLALQLKEKQKNISIQINELNAQCTSLRLAIKDLRLEGINERSDIYELLRKQAILRKRIAITSVQIAALIEKRTECDNLLSEQYREIQRLQKKLEKYSRLQQHENFLKLASILSLEEIEAEENTLWKK